MTQGYESDSKVIKFSPQASKCSSERAPSRDELVQMIRRVLSPAELFRMNATKSKRKKSSIEVIDFVLPEIKEKRNG